MGENVISLSLLGSTGSIGRQTLDVARAHPDRVVVKALAAGTNLQLLQEQAAEFSPDFIFHQGSVEKFSAASQPEFVSLEEMAVLPGVDVVLVATSGKAGLEPTLAAIRAGKKVALANKEALVMAGEIVMLEARKHRARIIPVDSEHSAVFQCLQGEKARPSRLLLTASGGPFRGLSLKELKNVTPEQALNHPSWRMGRKVTIDSATLMNKGLEVIEARWLFDMSFENINIIIHPQSIVHSMVEFADGSVKAQLGYPDMRLPIQYALSYPERWTDEELPRLDWNKITRLNFEPPDFDRFPCLKLAFEAGRRGGAYPAALCAADEVAVEAFLKKQIGFIDIPVVIEKTLEAHDDTPCPDLDAVMEADARARRKAGELVAGGRRG